MNSAAIMAVLALIEQVVGLLGTSNATVVLVENIINTLVKLLPYIIDEVSTVYQAVKNIIEQLQNHGAVTPKQQEALAELDAQVDAAWNEVESQLDPDAA